MNTKQLLEQSATLYRIERNLHLIMVEKEIEGEKVLTFYTALVYGNTTIIQNADVLFLMNIDLKEIPSLGKDVIGKRYVGNIVYLDSNDEDLETAKTIAIYSLAMIIEGPHKSVPATSKFSLKYLQFIRWSHLINSARQSRLNQAKAVLAEIETGRFKGRGL